MTWFDIENFERLHKLMDSKWEEENSNDDWMYYNHAMDYLGYENFKWDASRSPTCAYLPDDEFLFFALAWK